MIQVTERTSLQIAGTSPSLDALAESVRTDNCGAVVTFCGVVREDAHGNSRVVSLTYEVYESMALRELSAIAQEARERFGSCNIGVVQRMGRMLVGEVSVAIAVAAAHRAAAFDACEFIIDELKRRVPIWKKEERSDDTGRWLENGEVRA